MLRIPCPHCGLRDEIEFRYRGDASLVRPSAGAGGEAAMAEAFLAEPFLAEAFLAYVYERGNPAGWHVEWWLHVGGCRRALKLVRHTATHEVAWVGGPGERPVMPEADS